MVQTYDMEYMVIGADGKEYGPIDFGTLAQWAKDDRVRPNSMVKEFATGRTIQAAEVPGLFIPAATGPQSAPYYRPNMPGATAYQPQPVAINSGAFARALVYSGLSLVSFFLLGGLGLVFGAFSIMYAIRSKAEGHQHALLAIIASIVCTLIVIAGWIAKSSM